MPIIDRVINPGSPPRVNYRLMAGNGQVTCILAGLLPLDLPLPVALAQVEGQEMLESGFKVGVVVGSSAPLHTAAVAP